MRLSASNNCVIWYMYVYVYGIHTGYRLSASYNWYHRDMRYSLSASNNWYHRDMRYSLSASNNWYHRDMKYSLKRKLTKYDEE